MILQLFGYGSPVVCVCGNTKATAVDKTGEYIAMIYNQGCFSVLCLKICSDADLKEEVVVSTELRLKRVVCRLLLQLNKS